MFPYLDSSYYYIIGAIQIACIFHAMKTGRKDWMYLLIFLPLVGALIYFVREILPGLRTDGVASELQYAFIPNSRIKELERNLAIADTDTNKLNLAAEYSRQKQFQRAIELVRSCLTGIYANDPGMMLELARLLFYNNEFAESVRLFERVLSLKNNRFDKPEDDLLYARTLDSNNEKQRAEEEYKKVIRIHHSMEARFHYGLMLKNGNRIAEANEQFGTIQKEKDLHPKHIRRMNSEWIVRSKKELV